MDHQNPYRDPNEEPPVPSPAVPRWKVPRAAVGVGAAAFLAMAGAGAAFAVGGSGPTATTPGSQSNPSAPTPAPGARGHSIRGLPGRSAMLGPRGAVVHGIYTTRTGSGYKTMEIQVGTVQPGNTDSSITVKSSDGYSQTYTIQPSTVVNSQAGGISTVKSGDDVRVQALQQGNGYTATDVTDTSEIGSSRQGFGLTPPEPPGSASPGPVAPGE